MASRALNGGVEGREERLAGLPAKEVVALDVETRSMIKRSFCETLRIPNSRVDSDYAEASREQRQIATRVRSDIEQNLKSTKNDIYRFTATRAWV